MTARATGPLRTIVDWAEHFSVFGFGAAQLACGHEKIVKRGNHPRRTRCPKCVLGTCNHGKPKPCRCPLGDGVRP